MQDHSSGGQVFSGSAKEISRKSQLRPLSIFQARPDLPAEAHAADGTRPVVFKIERIDIAENDEEREWLAKQDFRNAPEDAYTG